MAKVVLANQLALHLFDLLSYDDLISFFKKWSKNAEFYWFKNDSFNTYETLALPERLS